MIEVKAPNNINVYPHLPKVFLTGSIEMGLAEPWQERLVNDFRDFSVLFLNPRRTDWDASWVQEFENPQFNEQVTWELNGLESAQITVFYFDPNTKSPITLMELGLSANRDWDNVIVCCPHGFYCKGNVDIVCHRYDIPVVHSYDELVITLTDYLAAFQPND
jgi:hypothetical protein